MKLKNTTFEYVWGQSGIQGFFGEGDEYPHHKLYKFLFGWWGWSFTGMTFVAKTTSWEPRIYPEVSNTALKDGYKLKQWFPASIWWTFFSIISGYLLNAMGIPTPGAMYLFYLNKWQKREDSFQLSFMAMKSTLEEKLEEVKEYAMLLSKKLPRESHKYGIQINFSCPNTGHEQSMAALKDWKVIIDCFRFYLSEVPIICKLDLTVEPEIVSRLHPYCDGIVIGNTIPFQKIAKFVRWGKYFPGHKSPLAKKFGDNFKGGLSGKPLFPVLVHWLERMEKYDPTVTIIAGGGIMKKKDIDRLAEFRCVKAIALGSVAITRPWRMKALIEHGNKIFQSKNKAV